MRIFLQATQPIWAVRHIEQMVSYWSAVNILWYLATLQMSGFPGMSLVTLAGSVTAMRTFCATSCEVSER